MLSVLSKEQLCPPHKQGSRLASGRQKLGLPQLHPCLNYTASSIRVSFCLQATKIQSARRHRLFKSSTYPSCMTQLACCFPSSTAPCILLGETWRQGTSWHRKPRAAAAPRAHNHLQTKLGVSANSTSSTTEESKPEPSGRQLSLNQTNNSHHALYGLLLLGSCLSRAGNSLSLAWKKQANYEQCKGELMCVSGFGVPW